MTILYVVRMAEPKLVVGVDFGIDDANALVVVERQPDGVPKIVDAHVWKTRRDPSESAFYERQREPPSFELLHMGMPVVADPPYEAAEVEKVRESWRSTFPSAAALAARASAKPASFSMLAPVVKAKKPDVPAEWTVPVAAETVSDDDHAFLTQIRQVKERYVGEPGERDPDHPCAAYATTGLVVRDCPGDGHYLCAEDCARYDGSRDEDR